MDLITRPVRVRMAPSPTGRTHIGSGRTALYNYLFARQTGGTFILRIEDTDQKRYVPGAEEELIHSLHWLGLEWDEGPGVGGPHAPYHQTQRKEIYQEYARQLIERGLAYYCFCTPDRLEKLRQEQYRLKLPPLYDGTCRNLDPEQASTRVKNGERHVIRFKMPKEGSISVHDVLRGEITVENRVLDDTILVKSDGLALYHLAAMVDDHLMDISHVLRGSEWLSTFPLHAHIIRAFGWQEPAWVHLSVFLKPSGKGKMSKRDSAQAVQDGYSIFIKDLQSLGYIPEAVVNWIALMGWSYDDHTEFFSMQDLIEKFSLEKLNPAPSAINFTKFDHFNGLHIRSLALDDLAGRIKPFFIASGYTVDDEILLRIIPLIRERLTTLDDCIPFGGFFFLEDIHPQAAELVGKDMSIAASRAAIQRSIQLLSTLPEISRESAEEPMRLLAEELGLTAGQLFGILRVATTGQTVSPPLFESMEIIGKSKVLRRLHAAIEALDQLASEI
jgi:glutamyl-tRNA synthetase